MKIRPGNCQAFLKMSQKIDNICTGFSGAFLSLHCLSVYYHVACWCQGCFAPLCGMSLTPTDHMIKNHQAVKRWLCVSDTLD